MTKTEKIIYYALILGLLLGLFASLTTCKDPQVALPGWHDTTLEFGAHHTLIVFFGERGQLYLLTDAQPGWYQAPFFIEDVCWGSTDDEPRT